MSTETSAQDGGTSASSNAPTTSSPSTVSEVVVHPLVLLSAADHYHRVARGTRKRAVGVLLGMVFRGKVDVTNSFAVPFEEDSRNPAVFYLDHNYLENMLAMFRKVNAKERVVGFYSTGPQIRPNDLRIHSLLKRFVPPGATTPPVFVIIDVRPKRESIPTTAYRVVEEVDTAPGGADSTEVRQTFAHVPSVIGALEAEEVGVEHLLRDINDPTISTVTSLIKAKMAGLAALTDKLVEMKVYVEAAMDGRVRKINQDIIANMQTILNLLPNLNVDELVSSMLVKTNDMHMVIYLSALIRSVLALHDLVNNKIRYNLDGDGEEKKEGTASADAANEDKKEDSDAVASSDDKKASDKTADAEKSDSTKK